MIFLLVAIVIVTNIIIIYTCTYTFSSKERTVQEVTVKDISQKSPIVVEALEENEENLEEIYPTGTTKYYIKVNCKSQTVNVYEKDENRIKEIDKEIRNTIYYKNKDIKKSSIIDNSYTKPNYVNKLYRVRKKTN